jgi:hypothetical protein
MNRLTEHEIEQIPGIPDVLPTDEHVLWQGQPTFIGASRHALHVIGISLYFLVLVLWQMLLLYRGEVTQDAAIAASGGLLVSGVAAVGILLAIGYAIHRTTIYTITNRRVIMRIGIALPITLNLPFSAISGAAYRERGAGTGDIVLSLDREHRIAYAVLWPHARAWRLRHPEPALRSLSDGAQAAEILKHALQQSVVPGLRPTPPVNDLYPQPETLSA